MRHFLVSAIYVRGDTYRVQGYLADKKLPTPLGPPQDPRSSYCGIAAGPLDCWVRAFA